MGVRVTGSSTTTVALALCGSTLNNTWSSNLLLLVRIDVKDEEGNATSGAADLS
jgi:hypothetical protein